jgi:hypothetical protein
MGPGARRLGLVAHVGISVGWLGSVVTSMVLATIGLTSTDASLVRAVYPMLELVGWWALIPFSLASLLTGLVQSLGTSWGLFRHYWVVTKLVMNVFATAVLLLYMQTLTFLAEQARSTPAGADPTGLREPSPVLHAAGAVVLLLVALVLSVYKPRGLTTHGRRRQQHTKRRQPGQRSASPAGPTPAGSAR